MAIDGPREVEDREGKKYSWKVNGERGNISVSIAIFGRGSYDLTIHLQLLAQKVDPYSGTDQAVVAECGIDKANFGSLNITEAVLDSGLLYPCIITTFLYLAGKVTYPY